MSEPEVEPDEVVVTEGDPSGGGSPASTPTQKQLAKIKKKLAQIQL